MRFMTPFQPKRWWEKRGNRDYLLFRTLRAPVLNRGNGVVEFPVGGRFAQDMDADIVDPLKFINIRIGGNDKYRGLRIHLMNCE